MRAQDTNFASHRARAALVSIAASTFFAAALLALLRVAA
jgi:hypothetical protein